MSKYEGLKKNETPVGKRQNAGRGKDKQIFQQPVLAVERMNCQHDPDHEIDANKDLQKPVLPKACFACGCVAHGALWPTVRSRRSAAMKSIAIIAPINAVDISFCAS